MATMLNMDAVKAALVAQGLKPRLTAKRQSVLDGLAAGGAFSTNSYGGGQYVLTAPDGAKTFYSAVTGDGFPAFVLCDMRRSPYSIVFTLKAAFIAD